MHDSLSFSLPPAQRSRWSLLLFAAVLAGCGGSGSNSTPPVSNPIGPAATPTFSPAAGTYTSAQSITLSDTTPNATIYYTTDGTTPTTSSPTYTAAIPLTIAGSLTVTAIAAAPIYSLSASASATYILNLSSTQKPNYTYTNVPIVGGGFVDGLFFHPKAQGLMYARTDVGGAYRWDSANGDKQWVPLLDFIGRFQNGFNLGVESLGLDPNDPTRLYLAVGEYTESYGTDGYILVSADKGNTFKAVSLPFKNGSNDPGRFAGERLSVDPANGKHIYFGTRQNGLYESTDQGNTWNPVSAFPVKSGTGTSFDPGVGVIFEQFLTTSSAAANGNTKTIYFGVSDPTINAATNQPTGLTGLYVSNDSGQTFTPVPGQPTGFFLNAGTFDPSNRFLYLSYARQAHVSAYGQTTPCTSGCQSVGPNGVNDGQIWRYTLPTATSPNGTWTNITPPLLTGESAGQFVSNPYGFSGVTVDPNHPDVVMVTTLNKYYPQPLDDIFRSRDDGATWVDYGVNAQRDGSLSPWINFGQSTPQGGNWINHLVVDPFNSDHMMYGTGATIWQTTNATAVDTGVTPGATTVAAGATTNWSIGAQGVEEAVILALASPPSGPHLFSQMYDLGGFTHTSLTSALKQQNTPEFTDGRGVDFAWQSAVKSTSFLVARVGDYSYQAAGSSAPTQLVGFSTDGGLTWTPNATLPPGVKSGAGSVAVAADGSAVVWMPSDSGASPAWTSNKGATWTQFSGAGPTQTASGNVTVIADRVNPKKFYLLAPSSNAVYISSDGGLTYTQVSTLPASASGLFASPAGDGDLWLTTYSGLYHSTNSGSTFTLVSGTAGETYALGFGMPAAGQTYPAVYMLGNLTADTTCADPNTNASAWFTTPTNCVYRSTDHGATWLHVNDYSHQYSNPGYIVGDPQVFGRYYLGTPGRGIIQADSPN